MKVETILKRGIWFIPLLLILVLAGCSESADGDEGGEEPIAVPVEIVEATSGEFQEEMNVLGRVEAEQLVQVTSKSPGTVSTIYAKKGARVEKGALLVQLDQGDQVDGVKQAEAALHSAQSNLANAKANRETTIQQGEQALSNAKLSYENAKLNYEQAAKNSERMQNLYEEGAISKQQWEQADLAAKQAKIGMDQALNAIRTSEENLASAQREEGIQMLEAALEQAQVSYEMASKRLAEMQIKAPIAGVVVDIHLEVGEQASPQVPLVTIANLGSVYVKGNITAEQLLHLQAGQDLPVWLDPLQQEVTGKVNYIGTVADERSRTYPLEVEVENREQTILPGMIAELRIPKRETAGNQILLPREAVLEEAGLSYVYVVEDGKAVKKEVVPGLESGTEIVVKEGLQAGEKVIVKGQLTISTGTPVQIVGGSES